MKYFILPPLTFLIINFSSVSLDTILPSGEPVSVSAYCDGWSDGYKEGYCYGKGFGCLEPLVPLCPLARLGEDGYRDGYNRGFLQGNADQ